ncbi:LPS export ABC transporter periplasmic protein LptC [Winogradskyella echinorum]|uniref:LPS export ABC transporter periplasmic protein LptC n=1 Tax=Winogradskyella echinorum TaxID=538189 RepID=A0ABR6Y3C2_9FLAO|nr:OstA-like protein [Winogradskyella echinorum]MBC3847232.1 LPS export ABC transporter periplasmic protein LptC [Winogradskyella echinorum]MBC5751580.1 LPS export ABC transporter periplasmic protein LptC [Winogradskyella echinorum]
MLFCKKQLALNCIKYFLFILCFSITTVSFAQKQKITVKYAGTLATDPEIKDGAKVFTRDKSLQVHFFHKGADVFCDRAIYYEDQDYLEAFGNVVMKQGDTINMTTKYIEYSGKTQLAFARGDVVLTDPQSVLTTDKLHYDRSRQLAYYDTKGKVVRDSSGTITSQIGRYYMNANKYQFTQDVVLVNPDYTLNTERLDFFTQNGFAYLFGPSTITGETSTIYCERGFYDTNNNTGHFQRNAKIDYDNRTVEGDSLYFDRNRSFASATNNITVTDTLNKSIVKGHYAEVWREKDSMYITKRALAITVQEKDSVYLHADKLMVTGKADNRITRAYYNARLYKSDLAGKADSIHVNHKTGLMQMINLSRFSSTDAFATKRKPVLWNLGNQMTGDTIHVLSNVETEKLDSLKVYNNAFLVSKDTLSKDNFNQIKGQRLIGLFRDNELYNVDIIKNAEVIYYSRNAENELVGINKSKSGSINIKIEAQEIEEIRLIQQIDGKLYPESEFPQSGKLFRGFDWRGEERPLSVEDLFKDDPPLVLPKIKGLADYVPPEDFIDESVSERIEQAGKETPNKPNKAAQNLPKKTAPIPLKPKIKETDSIKKPLKETIKVKAKTKDQ